VLASRRSIALVAAVAVSVSLYAPAARGQEGADEVHAPELLQFAEAEYPLAARGAQREGAVVLQLDIDAEGHVTHVEVKGPAGYGFDEAARAAALRFRFRPATRRATPVPARILYRYEFRSAAEGGASVDPPDLAERDRTLDVPAPAPPVSTDASPSNGTGETAPPPSPTEVTVLGASPGARRRQSAEAVTVVEMDQARHGSSDMGDLLGRTPGVGVRRQGGLGSSARFSLNGLVDDQVRFFLDGIPLELAGYPFGIASIPVNLVERVEIYGGVVPVRFGADALGGAVNLVTDRDRADGVVASYQVGSFDTHRISASGRYVHEPTGWVARVNGFVDRSRNDYPVDVNAPDEQGQLSPARVYRFHDAYGATGGNVEVGIVDRSWAKRLLVRAYLTDYDKEYQHNPVMTVPYGGVTYAETTAGVSLRYEQSLGRGVAIDGIGGYGYARGRFLDVATCVYDWFGRCVRERTAPGETGGRPHDQIHWDHSGFARLNLRWALDASHTLRLSVAPTYLTRRGDERRQIDPSVRDPFTAHRALTTLVNGIEYKMDLLGDRLENILFAKQYLQQLDGEEPSSANVFRTRSRDTHRFGLGNGIRYRLTPWLYAKASYEWATRLPRPDEIFSDNVFIVPNLDLRPEASHNGNAGLTVDARATSAGSFRATATGLLRETDQLIVLLGADQVQSYQNVFDSRVLGLEAAAGWTSPGDCVAIDGNVTQLDFRNTSKEGTFGAFAGDRIPNRPYLFANGTARFQLRSVVVPNDAIVVTWSTHYVHAFFRGWESIGLTQFKQTIPAQVVHTVGLGYHVRNEQTTLSMTLDVQNLLDAQVFDFFGVQRPGRAFYMKTTASF
jgi:TonB family protein